MTNIKGLAYISKNESATGKQPLFRGFINITPELLEHLNNATPDERGGIKLDVALWAVPEKKGVLKGSVSKPYVKEEKKPKMTKDDFDI